MADDQVGKLLQRLASSRFPPYNELPAAVARRLYREARAAVQSAPRKVESVRLELVPGPEGPVPVRLYRPLGSQSADCLPVLVFLHGGGWTIGDLDTHDVLCRALANCADCAVLSVEYRLAPEAPFPAAVVDSFAVLQFVFDAAATLNVDPTRVAVGGDSAGGNLATVIAILARDANLPPLALQLLLYPATDQRMGHGSIDRNGEGYVLTKKVMLYFRRNYLPDESAFLDWRASPLLTPTLAGTAPAHIVTAGYDPLLDEGLAYADRLQREGVATTYTNYTDMIHGFFTMDGMLDVADRAINECALILRSAFEYAGRAGQPQISCSRARGSSS